MSLLFAQGALSCGDAGSSTTEVELRDCPGYAQVSRISCEEANDLIASDLRPAFWKTKPSEEGPNEFSSRGFDCHNPEGFDSSGSGWNLRCESNDAVIAFNLAP